MSTPEKPDSQFQLFMQTFASAFGIEKPENVKTEQREIVTGSVRIDTVVLFSKQFDFTSLKDKIFPFWGILTFVEYKGKKDPPQVGHFYQYSLTELGLITTRYLSKEREDRADRNWLSQRALTKQWQQLHAQGAAHSCCTIILSTTDPRGARQELDFEPVTDYPHLTGALYRWVISENRFVGSLAVYLVVINHLPVEAKNVPLLLLSTGRKQIEFCQWLLSDASGLTIEEKRGYQSYLIDHNLIENEEIAKAMKYDLFGPPQVDWIFEGVAEKPQDYQDQFYQTALEKILQITPPEVMLQKALGASSLEEVALKVLRVASPEEVAQKALGTDSRVKAALKLLQTQEQMQEVLALLQERANQTANE